MQSTFWSSVAVSFHRRCVNQLPACHITPVYDGELMKYMLLQDYQFLYDQGVGAIFGPGTRLPISASETLKAIYKKIEQNKAKGV